MTRPFTIDFFIILIGSLYRLCPNLVKMIRYILFSFLGFFRVENDRNIFFDIQALFYLAKCGNSALNGEHIAVGYKIFEFPTLFTIPVSFFSGLCFEVLYLLISQLIFTAMVLPRKLRLST